MQRRDFLRGGALAATAGALGCWRTGRAAEPARPNILLLVADDLGWADVGWHGSKHHTPHLDQLVRTGVELDQHYVQPVCTPTRTALMSGRYPSRWGPHTLAPSNLRAFPPGTTLLPTALKSRGYETYLSGKWHLGSKVEWGPNRYGFDHSYGSLAGAADPWTHQYRPGPYAQTWHRDEQLLDEEGNATELVAAQAERWIRERRAPWFLYVPFQAVHIPIDAPDEYKRQYAGQRFHDDPVKDDAARRFAGFVTQMDAKVGQLLAALEQTGQRERTLVVFTSDNGGLLSGGNAYISKVPGSPVISSNLPLRGQKATLYEGGTRVCALANWPGHLTPRKVTAPLHAVDWMPTLTGLCGYTPPTDLKWDGQDIWPLLTGAVTQPPERTLYIAMRGGAVVRRGDWKLIARAGGRRELFDLGRDPYEQNDLAKDQPARVGELEALLAQFRRGDQTKAPGDLEDIPE